MTPERKAYLAKCGNREVWLRSAIVTTQKDISCQKQRISNATEEWIATGAKCELWHKKQLLMTLRHELQRIKGMDRVVVPFKSYSREVEDGVLVEYEVQTCPNCNVLVGGDLCEVHNYCPDCGRKILWERVK